MPACCSVGRRTVEQYLPREINYLVSFRQVCMTCYKRVAVVLEFGT
jgi:hypothetical protein